MGVYNSKKKSRGFYIQNGKIGDTVSKVIKIPYSQIAIYNR